MKKMNKIVIAILASIPQLNFATPMESRPMNKVIHLSAKLQVSQKIAFELFIKQEHLTVWLTTKANIEPRVGGKYELFWDPSNPEDNSTIGCHITALAPERLLSFEWKGPVQFKTFMNSADPLTHVVVSLSACEGTSDVCTAVEMVHSGWRESKEWSEAFAWQKRAWEGAFAELVKYANMNLENKSF